MLEVVEDHVIGRVFGLSDFLDDDALLALEFFEVEGRVLEDVGQDIDGERYIIAQDPGVIGSLFACGVGVDETADAFDFLGDAARRAPCRSLERHVLEHVGDAVRVLGFVARACANPHAHRCRLQMGHLVGDDSQTILKPGNGRGQSLDLSVRVALT